MSSLSLFFETKIYGEYHKAEAYHVVPAEFAHLKHFYGDYHKNDEAYNLLNHFELHKVKRTACNLGADAVGRDHHEIFEQRHTPACQNYENQRPILDDSHVRKFQIAIPRQRHENVGDNQKQNSVNSLHL